MKKKKKKKTKQHKKLRLKNIKDWEAYNNNVCVASRCQSGSGVTLATRKLAPVDVGLCDYHWEMYCEKEES